MRTWPRERYTTVAPFYDALSAEWPVYRAGRVAGVGALQLSRGDRVLDVGCGTGLSFPHLRRAIGPTGLLVGVDASADMLRVAGRRVRRRGWSNVKLVNAEAQTLTRDIVGLADGAGANGAAGDGAAGDGFDAVLFAYSLSVMPDRRAVWSAAVGLLRPGGRVAVVDMQVPTTNLPLVASAARLACRLGGSDIDAHPWTLLEDEGHGVIGTERRGGHIQVRAGRIG